MVWKKVNTDGKVAGTWLKRGSSWGGEGGVSLCGPMNVSINVPHILPPTGYVANCTMTIVAPADSLHQAPRTFEAAVETATSSCLPRTTLARSALDQPSALECVKRAGVFRHAIPMQYLLET